MLSINFSPCCNSNVDKESNYQEGCSTKCMGHVWQIIKKKFLCCVNNAEDQMTEKTVVRKDWDKNKKAVEVCSTTDKVSVIVQELEESSLETIEKELWRQFEEEKELWRRFEENRIYSKTVQQDYFPCLPIEDRSCRCEWISCPEKTNVKVSAFPQSEHGYIHANTVLLEDDINFIATIYPLNQAIFWSMVLEKGNIVVDVTNPKDLTFNEVEPYYPQKIGEECVYNDRLKIQCLDEVNLNSTMTKYELEVIDLETGIMRIIDRLHYIGWKDVSGTNELELKELVNYIEPYLGKEKVPVVHCMGGVGRTGTALTAVAMKRSIDQEIIQDANHLREKIEELIFLGRKQRGPEYVQTATQFITLWKLGIHLLSKNEIC